MRILVTGGAGYIGSHIVSELLKKKYDVIVVDTMEKGNKINLFPEAKFIQGEIQSQSILDQAFKDKIDAVFHFAAWKAAGESMTDPEKYTINNLNGTFRLLTYMAQHGAPKLIFSSSAAVYGAPQYLPIDENHPLNPMNYYGYTKLCIEQNLKWYDELRGVKYAALRYFNAAGYDINGKVRGLEKTPANLLPIVMEAACGMRKDFGIFGNDYDTQDGTCVRDYIHVNDLADAHLLSLDHLMKGNDSFTVNLGSESGYSVLEITNIAQEVVGKKIPHYITGRREGDPAKLLASSKKAKEILNWSAKYSDAKTLLSSMWEVYSKL